jgi:large subunit ribosomal protein L14e
MLSLYARRDERKSEVRTMSLYKVGRLCLKIAGRDAGKKCVIIETVDDTFVFVDGATRRKKVNVRHLEPLAVEIEIKDKASHEDVKLAFEKIGEEVWNKKSKKVAKRPSKVRKADTKTKEKSVKPKKQSKKEEVSKKEAKVEPSIEDTVAESPKVEEKKETVVPEVKEEATPEIKTETEEQKE